MKAVNQFIQVVILYLTSTQTFWNPPDDQTPLTTQDAYDGLLPYQPLHAQPLLINVDSYGAKGDGVSDDTEAFQQSWKEACSSSQAATFATSAGKEYLVKPLSFSGPCKSRMTVQLSGTIIASDKASDYAGSANHWLAFSGLSNLVVGGGATLDGRGSVWWQNSCKINKSKPCTDAPTALTFRNCNNLVVENLTVRNSQQIHITFANCLNVTASNLRTNSPGNSPNTDGIHVSATRNISISASTIAAGDDCISIVNGSERVVASGITCGSGHGFSIGSLGGGNSKVYVSDVRISGSMLSGTTNGLRIKTYQGGSGSASNIVFENIQMDNVKNPIIIDQFYCDKQSPCTQQASAVDVKNVVYQNIRGTSASEIAIDFNCSKKDSCSGIVLQNVNLVPQNGKTSEASCVNVSPTIMGSVSPRCPANFNSELRMRSNDNHFMWQGVVALA